MLLPFQGGINTLPYTQGDCPGLAASGPSGRSPYLLSVSLVFTLLHFDTPSIRTSIQFALKGHKILIINAFALAGRRLHLTFTHGVALG